MAPRKALCTGQLICWLCIYRKELLKGVGRQRPKGKADVQRGPTYAHSPPRGAHG